MTTSDENHRPGTLNRRAFIAITALGAVGLYTGTRGSSPVAALTVPDGLLDPLHIPKFQSALLIPPVMPKDGAQASSAAGGSRTTTRSRCVSSGSRCSRRPSPDDRLGLRRRALGVECRRGAPPRAVAHDRGDLGASPSPSRGSTSSSTTAASTCRTCCRSTRPCTGPTLRAASQGATRSRSFSTTPGRYTGPVPMVTHVHGMARVGDDSDGYAEAWYLPDAVDIPRRFANEGDVVRLLRRQGRPHQRRGVAARIGDVRLPERPASRNRLVPRPHAGHDPRQRLRRSCRVLPHPRRAGG